jgi:hypothetical protein
MVDRTVADLGELSEAEERVLATLDTGKFVVLGDGTRPECPDAARRVRATLIRMLLVPREGDGLPRLHQKGLQITGAWIPDALDLEGCRIGGDLALVNSRFDARPVLMSATIDGLYLNGSRLPGLEGDRLDVRGNVVLRDVEARGEVRLLGAKLGGNLDCMGAQFFAEKDAAGTPGFAFSADRLDAAGSVFLRGVKARGAVRLIGAKLGGDLDCEGAQFFAEKDAKGTPGFAFAADMLDAAGRVFLRGVEARGEVRLLRAKLGGDLVCEGAQFFAEKDAEGTPGDAFSADGLDAAGNVFLRGVKARGAVRLLGAKLGGDLVCLGAHFSAEKDAEGTPGVAFTATGLQAKGVLFLRDGTMVDGVLDLRDAEVGALCDALECWPTNGNLVLDRFRYGAFVGRAPVDADSRCRWLALQDPTRWGHDFWPQPYVHCAKVLREMGHGGQARMVLADMERQEALVRMQRYPMPLRLLAQAAEAIYLATIDRGRQPLRAFVWLAFFLIVGTLWFRSAEANDALKPNVPLFQQSAEWANCAETGALRAQGESRMECPSSTQGGELSAVQRLHLFRRHVASNRRSGNAGILDSRRPDRSGVVGARLPLGPYRRRLGAQPARGRRVLGAGAVGLTGGGAGAVSGLRSSGRKA